MQVLSTRSEVAKLLAIFLVSLGPCYLGDSNLADFSFVLTLLELLLRINMKLTVKTTLVNSHCQGKMASLQNNIF